MMLELAQLLACASQALNAPSVSATGPFLMSTAVTLADAKLPPLPADNTPTPATPRPSPAAIALPATCQKKNTNITYTIARKTPISHKESHKEHQYHINHCHKNTNIT
jgi:hypothetical protein